MREADRLRLAGFVMQIETNKGSHSISPVTCEGERREEKENDRLKDTPEYDKSKKQKTKAF